MPKCVECKWFDASIPECKGPGHRSPLKKITLSRRCIFGILTQNLEMVSGKVLEIGYGKVHFLRKKVSWKEGCTWYGLEPRWPGDEEKRQFNGKVSKTPFDDEFFDCVICSQCIEHWESYGDSVLSGTNEIYRILKKGGLLFIDVPIHSHGSSIFTKGDLRVIRSIFDNRWEIVVFEEWRKEYKPLPQIEIPPAYREYAMNFSGQEMPSEWILNIVVKKRE